MKLFSFPYAGGSSHMFNDWEKGLQPKIELRAVELAGRGQRFGDDPYDSFQEAVDDLFEIIKPELRQGAYAFFGHSLGAHLAYEIAMRIKDSALRQPSHLFFSGAGAPDIVDDRHKDYHLLGEEDFKDKLKELGGTPPEFFELPELAELFLPVLRNDFKLASEIPERLIQFDCDISVLVGNTEDLTADQVYHWKNHSAQSCDIHFFDGGHFFINDHLPGILDLINTKLA